MGGVTVSAYVTYCSSTVISSANTTPILNHKNAGKEGETLIESQLCNLGGHPIEGFLPVEDLSERQFTPVAVFFDLLSENITVNEQTYSEVDVFQQLKKSEVPL